jgi:ethanolamine utilization protein EutN
MRIGKVIGTVTLNRSLPSFRGARLRMTVPLSLADLVSGEPPQAEAIVVWDDLGAGDGSRIAVSEGPEASRPFHPEIKPVDAYNAAILDTVDLNFDEKDVSTERTDG